MTHNVSFYLPALMGLRVPKRRLQADYKSLTMFMLGGLVLQHRYRAFEVHWAPTRAHPDESSHDTRRTGVTPHSRVHLQVGSFRNLSE